MRPVPCMIDRHAFAMGLDLSAQTARARGAKQHRTDILVTDAKSLANVGAVVVRTSQCADLVCFGGLPFDNFICRLPLFYVPQP
jgi:hypothetical protein